MAHSTLKIRPTKAVTLPSDFPLYPVKSGAYVKKIKGKRYHFGMQPNWEAALRLYHEIGPFIEAFGRKPTAEEKAGTVVPPPARTTSPAPTFTAGLNLREACNRFCTHKKRQAESRGDGLRSYADHLYVGRLVSECFAEKDRDGNPRKDANDKLVVSVNVEDLTPDDFIKLDEYLGKGRAVATHNKLKVLTKAIFKFCRDQKLIGQSVDIGQALQKLPARDLRKYRKQKQVKNGKKMFEASELRIILDNAPMPLKAMILLGVNCGFGATDLANLPLSALDLVGGWVDYPRPKTWIDRKAKLWPETVAALRKWLPKRPKPKDPAHDGLVFLTRCGTLWVKVNAKGNPDDSVSKECSKLLKKLGLKRTGVSFYALRHTFATIASGSLDQVATNFIMGHADPTVEGAYREEIPDDRLTAVSDHVRAWLFPPAANEG